MTEYSSSLSYFPISLLFVYSSRLSHKR